MTRSKFLDTGLTPGQEAFCLEFMKNGGNATEAYRKAYPGSHKAKASTMHRQAHAMVRHPKVVQRLEKLRDAVAAKAVLTRQEALEALTRIVRESLDIGVFLDGQGRIDMQKVLAAGAGVQDLDEETVMKPDEECPVRNRKLKLRDPVRAIERLARLEAWDKQPDDSKPVPQVQIIVQGV
jgi:phage terminase small subunit